MMRRSFDPEGSSITSDNVTMLECFILRMIMISRLRSSIGLRLGFGGGVEGVPPPGAAGGGGLGLEVGLAHGLHRTEPQVVGVQAEEDLATGPAAEELDHEVLVHKHAALYLVDAQRGGLLVLELGGRGHGLMSCLLDRLLGRSRLLICLCCLLGCTIVVIASV